MSNKHELSQRQENERLVEQINAYWSERGVEANARVEHITVPVSFKYVERSYIDQHGKKRSYRVIVFLPQPDLVSSWEIVSDLGAMAATWVKWSAKKRRRAA